MKKSLQVLPQGLILPANKDTQTINWDRKSADLNFSLSLKNYWKPLAGQNIQVQVRPMNNSSIEPLVASVVPQQSMSGWASQEEKVFKVNLKIKDQTDPSLSRLPSELSYTVTVLVNGQVHRQFEMKAEVIVSVTDAVTGGDVFGYDLNGQIPRGMKLSLVDEVLDAKKMQRDYYLIGQDDVNKGTFNIALVRNQGKAYNIEKIQNLKFDGDITMSRPQYKVRIDLDGDGKSEYIFGVIEYLDKEQTIYGDYRNHFYIFDDQMNLIRYVVFDDKRAAMPYSFYWMKINGKMRPAWVGKGQEVVKKYDITDLWGTDGNATTVAQNVQTPEDIHFYFLNEDFKLDQLQPPTPDDRIVDIIQSSSQDVMNGVLSVLIARNAGTELKPSYISQFSVAKVQNGKLGAATDLNSLSTGLEYRNLIDTFADKTMSLISESSEFRGTMWYGLDSDQRQRVTFIDLGTQKIVDKLISSERKINDSALLVKAGFQSPQRKGVFLITNSELEYHDISTDQVASRSLNRYSFIGDSNFVELYFPITLVDRLSPTQKLPALFTTEQSELSRGIRLLTPIYNQDGSLGQLVTPARLRLKSEQGCKPLEAPVFLGDQLGYAMDYQCSNKIVRFLLKY
ncbi:MAG: hypothetical protein ACXVAX_07100 [Pseudobdellovibrio sp.]